MGVISGGVILGEVVVCNLGYFCMRLRVEGYWLVVFLIVGVVNFFFKRELGGVF